MRDKLPKSTRTQGGDTIADYIMADTPLPLFLPYPRFLLKMEISQTAKLLYSLLLDRSTLSQKNKWQDDKGRIYIIYPIAEIAEILDKGSTTIKGALNELDMAGLLERERGGFSAPNRLYVKVPRVPQVQFSDQLMAGKPTLTEPENRPTDGQKTDLMMVGKPSPNQTTINNLTESQTMGASGEPPAPYGRYQNIFLSKTEYDELQAEYPDRLERFIEEMSRYLAANGKSYQNYAAALPSFRTPYMEFFLGLDLSASLSGITCPVMALNGTKDTQVQCDRNIAALEAGLPSNSRSVIRAEDGLNHLFQHCVTGEVSEYKNIEETFSPEVLSEMIAWIKTL